MIECECLKCGERGKQKIRYNGKERYLDIIHKNKICELGLVKTTEEALSELGFI